jgi:hypothetical protein
MVKYDIRKMDKHWVITQEGSAAPLSTFESKREAVLYGRRYLKSHGGVLRIWKADGTSLLEERIYEKEQTSVFGGILKGFGDAIKATGEALPTAGKFLSKGVYESGYYASYGVVYGATMIARLIPWPDSLTHGVHDGTEAALGSTEEKHHPDNATPTAS